MDDTPDAFQRLFVSDPDVRLRQQSAGVGAAIGAVLGSRRGPVAAGVAAGVGGAGSYLLASAVRRSDPDSVPFDGADAVRIDIEDGDADDGDDEPDADG
jgi:hypothetical protein